MAYTRKKKAVAGGDSLLNRFQHHQMMANKHRAHADLINAKLRTQGKRITTDYHNGSESYRMEDAAPRVQNTVKTTKRRGKK